MPDILQEIFARKRERVEACKAVRPLRELQSQTLPLENPNLFLAALQQDRTNIIAEVKRRSPSKGVIRENFDPVAIAKNYTSNGAACLSVLTEEDYFDGSLEHLKAVRAVTDLPIIRKDFIFDEYQIFEAASAKANCILLIAAMLEPAQFNDLMQTAYDYPPHGFRTHVVSRWRVTMSKMRGR